MSTRLVATLSEWFARSWLLPVTVSGSLLAAFLVVFAPQMGIILVLVVLAVVCWYWMRLELSVRALVAQVARGETPGKVEVGHGAWGRLCHVVNSLVQQQRLVQRKEALLPALPPDLMDALLEGRTQVEQTPCTATILLVGVRSSQATADSLAALASSVQTAAAPHHGLVQRCGDAFMVVCGLGRPAFTVPGLRAALHTALAVRTHWLASGKNDGSLVMALAAGPLLAGTLPGLGYGVVGTTVLRAQRLYSFATAANGYTALCDEETYVALRQLGIEGRMLPMSESWEGSPMYRVEFGDSLAAYESSFREQGELQRR